MVYCLLLSSILGKVRAAVLPCLPYLITFRSPMKQGWSLISFSSTLVQPSIEWVVTLYWQLFASQREPFTWWLGLVRSFYPSHSQPRHSWREVWQQAKLRYHVRGVVSRVSRRIGILRFVKRIFVDTSVFLRFYFAFVLAIFEYCSPVWRSTAESHLQLLAGQVYSGGQATRVQHPRATAAAHPLKCEVSRCRTSQFARSFLPAQVRIWNNLPNTVFVSCEFCFLQLWVVFSFSCVFLSFQWCRCSWGWQSNL